MIMVHLRTEFQMASSIVSLALEIKQKAKYRFHAASMLFFFVYILQKTCHKNVTYFSKFY